MPRYQVTTTVEYFRKTVVDADNAYEAKEMALNTYNDDDYDENEDEYNEPRVISTREITDDYDPTEDDDA